MARLTRLGHAVDERDDPFVGDALGPDDAQSAQDLVAVAVVREDQGTVLDVGQVGLGADQDLDPVQADEIREQPDERRLLLELLEEGPELAHVGQPALAEEPGGPLEEDPVLPLFPVDRGLEQVEQLVERVLVLDPVLGEIADQGVANGQDGLAPEALVDVLGGPVELGLAQRQGRFEGLGEDHVEGRHQDDQDAPVGDLDEPEVLEREPEDVGRDDESEVVRGIGQDPAGLDEQGIEIGRAADEFLLDERDPLLREGLVGEEAADVMAQSLVGRQPSGGCVGLRQEAHGLELDHDVAQGRRRRGDPPGLAERPRAHRPAVPDEALDDESQDLLILVAQYRLRHPSSSAFYSIKPDFTSTSSRTSRSRPGPGCGSAGPLP